MKTLNLISINDSDIKYHVDTFPDGEKSLVIDSEIDRKDGYVTVITRIAAMDNLFILAQAGDILSRHEIHYDIYVTYLMSMRMDRVMDFNRPYSLKVMTSMINTIGYDRIFILEAHSSKTISNLRNAYHWLDVSSEQKKFEIFNESYTLVFPDDGAKRRYLLPGICFEKKRDLSTGQIIGILPKDDSDIKHIKNPNNTNFIVIDDLCDAGGTFCGVAAKLKELNPDINLSVFVTHMVNRKGIENLSKNYDKVIFTNSYKDWENLPENVEMIKLY